MDVSLGRYSKSVGLALSCLSLMAVPALALTVYNWEPEVGGVSSGQIVFNDTIGIGSTFSNNEIEDVVDSFSFSDGAGINWELSLGSLQIGGKKTTKGTPGNVLTLKLDGLEDTNLGGLIFRVKAGKGSGGTPVSLPTLQLFSDSSPFDWIAFSQEGGKKGQAPTYLFEESGAWVLDASSLTPVPAPGALVIMLSGLAGLAALGRSVRKRANARMHKGT